MARALSPCNLLSSNQASPSNTLSAEYSYVALEFETLFISVGKGVFRKCLLCQVAFSEGAVVSS